MPNPQNSSYKSPANHKHVLVGAFILVSFVSGVVGGMFGIFFVNNYFSLTKNRSQRVVLEENSAIVEVAKKLEPSVVSITNETATENAFGQSETSSGAGTGIIIREDGLILTNKHVVPEGSSNVTVTLNDGKRFENAQVLARDPQLDLAFLKVNAKGLTAAELGDSDQVVVGQKVIAIGNALGEFENTVTAGIISGLGRPLSAGGGSSEVEQLQDLLQTDAAINPGNSGGPLVNIEGQVIGINTAIADSAENIGFAIPINQAKAGITSIEDTGKLSKPFLGVRYISLNKEIAQANKLSSDTGAWVKGDATNPGIMPGSPAAKSGLKDGDIITKVDGEEINENRSLSTLISKHKVGDEVKLTIIRNGKTIKLTTKLEQLPS